MTLSPSDKPLRRRFIGGFLAALTLLGLLPQARAHWPNTNATKWVQLPNTINGLDVLAAQAPGAAPLILADDFLCRQTGPVTDIHLWTSWLGDTQLCNVPITLSIWTDVPAITNVTPPIASHPGSMLWSQTFAPGRYTVQPWKTAEELFWNPDPAPFGRIVGPDHLIWQYNFYPTDPFTQRGTPDQPIVYWLAMTAGTNTQYFGWKTAARHWNDDAVFAHTDSLGNSQGDWKELRDPRSITTGSGPSLDLAFALTTPYVITNPPPPTNKWVQYPDQLNGYDILDGFPNILADDFLCKAAGVLTNIQIWGSWKDNATPDPNLTFTLGIWSDVPGGTTTSGNTTFSHPGTLLWTETFVPGTWSDSFWGNGQELFYDPTAGTISPESQIWLYNFNPRRPFCQKGSANSPVIYWLSLTAKSATGNIPQFGWKTSTNHNFDDAVFGHMTSTGTVPDWKDLHDPRVFAALVSLDLAFLINNGPPTPDCDNNNNPRVKFIQPPDTTRLGLDVRANSPKVVGDDFLCKVPGTLNGISVWGSWLGDKVDTNVTFQLSLWTDIPKQPGATYSHPGQLLCTSLFYPPTAVGTSLARYNYSLAYSNLTESFYDPDSPVPFIGNDTQIWRYDFYPRLPCWRQAGTPSLPRTYWLTLSANTTGQDAFLFGWKTSITNWNDDAVWGHTNNIPPGDWKDLHDPRNGKSLDLSFALRSFPIIGVNKDLRNTTTQTAIGIQITLMGIHEVTWHYDDAPPWTTFTVTYTGGNTVLQWTGGKTVPVNGISYVGFEIGGTSIDYASVNWIGITGALLPAVQVSHHIWNGGNTLVLNNDLATTPVTVLGGTAEFYTDPVGLDQMIPGGNRNPIATVTLPIQPGAITPGCTMRIPLPQRLPAGAQYVMFNLSLGDSQGQQATTDFIQLPLDTAVQPVVTAMSLSQNAFNVTWPTLVDRTYRIQRADDLRSGFFDVFTEIMGDGSDKSMDLPVSGSQGFYRILLDPQ